jgi:hypothetical protein
MVRHVPRFLIPVSVCRIKSVLGLINPRMPHRVNPLLTLTTQVDWLRPSPVSRIKERLLRESIFACRTKSLTRTDFVCRTKSH